MATDLESEARQSPPATNGLKRRQSEVSEQESKRLRTSPGKISSIAEPSPARHAPSEGGPRRESTDKVTAAHPSPPPTDARRKSSAVSEKDRSRRLFGGLLGSLSQKDDSRTTKRRQEIESRRKAELQRQDDEHVEDKQKRLEQLAEKRRRVKKRLEDETMRNRHRDMLHSANFLHTSAQPRLLYKPWELRDDEEYQIDDQISQAKAQIEQELAGPEATAMSHAGVDEGDSANTTTADKTLQANDANDGGPSLPEQLHTPNQALEGNTEATNEQDEATPMREDTTQAPSSPQMNGGHTVQNDTIAEPQEDATTNQDEQDDHVVEGEEDTVIY